jgi:hexosaminidase
MQYGCATLAQLCLLSWDGWRVRLPGCIIEDEPALSWRGVMVDSVRHFQSIQDLKKLLSSLSLYKINRLHWHLSDDQGWRIELPAIPLATEIGSYRQGADPNRNGRYTREEIQDLVSYAEARGITIVPELDLPGHVQAVLAAYPDLSCTGGPFTVRTTWGIAEDVLCMGNPKALEFAKNAWDSILDLFPGDWVHIGGDECPTMRWESCPRCNELKSRLGVKAWVDLHGWFIKEISAYLQNRGKIVFGWDEVLDSTMDNRAGVFHWRSGNKEASIEALNRGRDLVRCPQDPYYFDRVQTVNRQDSPGVAGTPMATVKRVFEFDPFAGLPEDCLDPTINGRGTLLGIQVNAWTEFMSDFRRLQYMLFPRVLAAAETGWRGKNRLSWDDFAQRLGIIPVQGNQTQRKILDMLAINYCSAAFNAENL